MKLLVVDNHYGEGTFPVFSKDTVVNDIKACDDVPHWLACSIDGMDTFVPDCFLDGDRLTVDYGPTELVLAKGEVVELERIVYEWLYVKTKDGVRGWLPASKAVSIHE